MTGRSQNDRHIELTAFELLDELRARAKALGVHDGINYRRDPDWATVVLTLTGGRGADHIIEVGGPQSSDRSLKAAARGAQINVIGYLGGSDGPINPLDIFRRQVRARGIPVGSRETFEAMNRALFVNGLRPVIDRVFPWMEAAEAFRHLEHGSPFGKVVLDHTQ
ncbi:zinc-binding dehydrogenase [Mesorhizobium sp. ORM6]